MKCPKCGCENSKVAGSKATKSGYFRRRRICADCGEKFSTIEIREDEFTELTGYKPGKQLKSNETVEDEASKLEIVTNSSNSLDLSCLSGINKKLNIIAKALAAKLDKPESNSGIQPKKPKNKKKAALDESLEEYENDIAADLASIEDDPDPSDIHAWAVLIASLA